MERFDRGIAAAQDQRIGRSQITVFEMIHGDFLGHQGAVVGWQSHGAHVVKHFLRIAVLDLQRDIQVGLGGILDLK
jgi:hypothetical protein